MIVSATLLPSTARDVELSICIVLDVLRASSTILAMVEAGASEILLASSPEEALAIADVDRPRYLVCGERDGLPPPKFDFGNSPVEVAEADLARRPIVYATSNGTGALKAVSAAPLVLVGGPRNALAVVHRALEEAGERELDILIVCAGDDGGRSISLEDAFVAGMIVDRFVRHGSKLVTPEEARSERDVLALDESAILVHRLYRSYVGPGHEGPIGPELLQRVFTESRNGRDLPRKGLADDLEYCAAIDVSTVVPCLVIRDRALAIVPSL